MSKVKSITDNQEFLKGKRVLITSYSYANFGGAELNAVELAEQLVEFGAIPYFFSYDVNGPLAQFINDKFNTEVLTDDVYYLAEDESESSLKNTHFDIRDYDYIWVGANTIPISILKQLNTAKSIPKFIFIHMSPLIAFPLDAPLLPEFEKKIASKILSIGESTTKECIHRILGENVDVAKWYNPAPAEFGLLPKRNGKLKKIAVISSSHPTNEVMDIREEIERHGIEIDYIGGYNNNTQRVDASLYDKYDLIIGIGKNAKYSLVSGVPIYIYGRFGGPGYVKDQSFKISKAYNFSGRGFGKKTAKQIAHEVVAQYDSALQFHEEHREKFIQEFSIDVVTERLFRKLEAEDSRNPHFSNEYINWLVSMQINLMQDMKRYSRLKYLDSRIQELENTSQQTIKELDRVYGSNSWKVTKPLRSIVAVLKKLTNI